METDQGNRGIYSSSVSHDWQNCWKYKFYTITKFGNTLLQTIAD